MNLKKWIIIIAILLLAITIISVTVNSVGNNKTNQSSNQNNQSSNEKVYHFNETVNLDTEQVDTDLDPEMGTDYPSLGTISDYYDNTDIYYEDDSIYIQSYDGYDVVSSSWKNEGYAIYINEPTFGEIEKFVLSDGSVSARYTNVKMKDTVSYINELAGLGFNDVQKNKKNNSADYYIYSAKNGERTVTLNYEKGVLVIMVF